MAQKIDPAEAEVVMRAAGCVPLVPYPGSGVPWPCLHEPCGEQIAPLYSNVKKRGRACQRCADEKRSETRRARLADEAESTMRAAGCVPLVPYPGSGVPWPCLHEPCGEQITPTFANVRKRGAACRKCGAEKGGTNRRAGLANEAVATMRAAQFVPLEPYPGADKPWRCLHEPCGQLRTPALNTVRRNGTACRDCWYAQKGYAVWTAETAETCFRNHGLEPLDPYPGSHLVAGRLPGGP